jgi:hypothetical protein
MWSNTRRLRMTGIMTPAVRLHDFGLGLRQFQALGFCCTECTLHFRLLFWEEKWYKIVEVFNGIFSY